MSLIQTNLDVECPKTEGKPVGETEICIVGG